MLVNAKRDNYIYRKTNKQAKNKQESIIYKARNNNLEQDIKIYLYITFVAFFRGEETTTSSSAISACTFELFILKKPLIEG